MSSIMEELNELLRPSWGSERWILEGWERLNSEEKKLIKQRLADLFKDGLPFELKHPKLLYIYTFSLLAQLEVLAIQVPLKFEDQMTLEEDKQRLHIQLLDEIFHGLVFTKILYLLCAPQSLPPPYSENLETICNFIRNEQCPKVGILLLNLVGEGWIEEIFYSLEREGIASNVFRIILDDEHRHVSEADLYRTIGMPNLDEVRVKLEFLEEQLLTNIFLQYKYVYSIISLLGVQGTLDFIHALDAKHKEQLKKINLVPSEKWQFFMHMLEKALPKIHECTQANYEVEMTPIRKFLMTQWDDPTDPTMIGEFKVNVSCMDFFNKKYPAETLTLLMLQTVSAVLMQHDSFRSFLSHKQLYQSKNAYLGLVVKLPECGDHMGTIVFENCHTISIFDLSNRIRIIMQMMVYCYKKREELEKKYPHLKLLTENMLYDFANDFYGYPIPGTPVVSLSNVGFYGFTHIGAPLRCNEVLRVTLTKVAREPVWNEDKQDFEPQDILPISISADHRIFDGNIPIPKVIPIMFQEMFQKMLKDIANPTPVKKPPEQPGLAKSMDHVLERNLELGYKTVNALQTVWADFMDVEEVFDPELTKKIMEMSDYDSISY